MAEVQETHINAYRGELEEARKAEAAAHGHVVDLEEKIAAMEPPTEPEIEEEQSASEDEAVPEELPQGEMAGVNEEDNSPTPSKSSKKGKK